jgi:hypothetical protein
MTSQSRYIQFNEKEKTEIDLENFTNDNINNWNIEICLVDFRNMLCDILESASDKFMGMKRHIIKILKIIDSLFKELKINPALLSTEKEKNNIQIESKLIYKYKII